MYPNFLMTSKYIIEFNQLKDLHSLDMAEEDRDIRMTVFAITLVEWSDINKTQS
jgi:hypothetical protein